MASSTDAGAPHGCLLRSRVHVVRRVGALCVGAVWGGVRAQRNTSSADYAPCFPFGKARCSGRLIFQKQSTGLFLPKRSTFRASPLRVRTVLPLWESPVFRSAYFPETVHWTISSKTLDLPDPIGLFAYLLALRNQINQPLILCFPSLPFPPCIVSAAGDLKHLTHRLHAVLAAESLDHPILQLHLLPTSDRKFRKSSTCIRSCTISLFRFTSSLAGSLRGRPLGRGMYPFAIIRSFLRWRPMSCRSCFFSNP